MGLYAIHPHPEKKDTVAKLLKKFKVTGSKAWLERHPHNRISAGKAAGLEWFIPDGITGLLTEEVMQKLLKENNPQSKVIHDIDHGDVLYRFYTDTHCFFTDDPWFGEQRGPEGELHSSLLPEPFDCGGVWDVRERLKTESIEAILAKESTGYKVIRSMEDLAKYCLELRKLEN